MEHAPLESIRCERLRKWFEQNGGFINPNVTLADDAPNGIHLRATASIETGTSKECTVCTCPFALTISHLNVVNGNGLSAVSRLVGRVPSHVIAYFFLAEQRLLGAKSLWEPYVSSLPKESDLTTPLYFSEEDCLYLLGTNLFIATESRRADWQNEWKAGCEVLRREGVETDAYTWQLYLWAATMFSSRSFASAVALPDHNQNFPILYPVIDICNHRMGARVTWRFDHGTFSLCIGERAQAGEQIYNNYAPKGNEELLLGYGFCIANNPCDEMATRLGRPPELVHAKLKKRYPSHFRSQEWAGTEAVFYLRGRNHISGSYGNDVPCFRSIPPIALGIVFEIVLFRREQDVDPKRPVAPSEYVIRDAAMQLLHPLHHTLGVITQHDHDVPDAPANTKQKYAKIYRDSQVQILRDVIEEIKERNTKWRRITLGDALAMWENESPMMCQQFLQGLEVAFGSSDVEELRAMEVDDMCWAILLSALRIYAQQPSNKDAAVTRWMSSLTEEYGYLDNKPGTATEELQDVMKVLDAARQQCLASTLWTSPLWCESLCRWGLRVSMLETSPTVLNGRVTQHLMCVLQS